MFSGKSTELLRQMRRQVFSGKRCILIKYKGDNRYSDNKIITHDGHTIELNTLICDDILDVMNKILIYDVIGIDECQFFKNTYLIDTLANNKIVICSSLDGDYNRNPFTNIVNLIPKCENLIKLTAICKCGKEANFSKIKIQTDHIINIGGENMYEPVCRKCHSLNKSK